MAISLAPNLTQRNYNWTTWKSIYNSKGSPFQYEDDGNLYTIWTYDGIEVHICQIWKQEVPYSITEIYSQAQNDSDKSDFETNYKSTGNQSLTPLDTDGALIVRNKAAKKGWTYFICPVEFTTAKLNSVYSKNQDNSDRSGITYKIYDSNNAEITTTQNEPNAVKTVIDFEPNYDYEIIGGQLQQHSKPSTNIRVWVIGVPDVPEGYGGSKEMVGGVNLKFVDPADKVDADGRVCKYMSYNATYHTNKLRLIIRHDAGVQHDILMILEMFKA